MIDVKKIKDAFKKDKLAKFKIDKDKMALAKEHAGRWTDKLVSFFKTCCSTLRNIFTKESVGTLKASFKENTKAYIIFGLVGIFLVVSLGVSIKKLSDAKAAAALQQKVAITTNAAEEYFYNGQYEKAVGEYLKLKEKNSSEGLWDAKIAEVYSVMGKIDNSKEFITKAIEQGDKNPEVLNYAVFTEFMNKDYASALKHGEEALSKFPQDKKLIKTMFTVYMANNMMDKAKQLVSSYPADIKSAYEIAEYARMLMVVGQWEEGYKELRMAWNLDKDEYKVYDVLAQIAVYNNDVLIENITSLAEKNPNDLAYKMWLAKIYSLNDSTADEAIKLVDELKSQDLGKIEIKLIEAAALQKLKQTDKADELIKKVIDENKDDYRVLHTAGWYYLNKMDFAKAESYCRESIVKNKNYTDNYGFLMPEILKAQGKSTEGEPFFRTALYKEPYNYNIMLTVANYYWYTTKNTDKAMENFKLAEIIKPDDAEIKYNMALINVSNKKNNEAIELLKKSIQLADSVAKYHRTLGTIYLLNGKPADAIKEIRYAYGSDETDIMTLNNAGCYYVTQDANLQKGEYNLRKAQEGITEATDKYTADTVNANYKKVKELLDKYNSGSNETLKIPELVLFY